MWDSGWGLVCGMKVDVSEKNFDEKWQFHPNVVESVPTHKQKQS